MLKASELRDLESAELVNHLGETKTELFNLRFQLATGQLENISRISQLKRDIARIETVMAERKIAAGKSQG